MFKGKFALALIVATTTAVAGEQRATSTVELEEVVVTAQKRSESLQKVPSAITAISGEELQQLGITQSEDLSKLTPGLAGTKAGGIMTQYYIRGVGNYGTSAFSESAVATNLNGVNLSRPTTLGGMFYDLERVEVLKGPQGTLYGRNATGGAVNLISRRPTREREGNVAFEAGNYSHFRVNGALSGPASETWALRGAFQWNKHDGYLSDGYDDEDTKAARFSALYEPRDGVSWLTVVDYEDVGGVGGGGVITPLLDMGNPWIGGTDARSNAVLTAFGGPFTRGPIGAPNGFTNVKSVGVSSELNWDLGSTSLTVLPAYRDSDVDYLSWAPGFQVTEHDKSKTTSIELRLAGNIEQRLQWVLGGYYFNEDTTSDGYFLQQVRLWANFPAFPPVLGPLSATENSTRNHYDLTTKAWALFGQSTINVTDDVRLTGGVRYTREDKGMTGFNLTDPPNFPGPVPPFTITTPGAASWNDTTYRAGIEYDATDKNLLYANVSTGFKAGGFFSEQPKSQASCSAGNSFEPEKLTAYAIGSKNRFANGRVQLNAEAFDWDYKDHQEPHLGFSACGYTIFPTENIGQATMRGLDLEMLLTVATAGRLSVQLQYLDATFDKFSFTTFSPAGNPGSNGGSGALGCPATLAFGPLWTVNCDGKQAIRAPKFSGSVGYRHAQPLNSGAHLIFDLRAQFASSTFVAIDYRDASKQDAYTTGDASLSYEAPGAAWSVGVWGRNISNKAISTNSFTSPFTLVNYTQLKAPRTVGLNASFKF
jgi:iron complex outermembrane recepter protein